MKGIAAPVALFGSGIEGELKRSRLPGLLPGRCALLQHFDDLVGYFFAKVSLDQSFGGIGFVGHASDPFVEVCFGLLFLEARAENRVETLVLFCRGIVIDGWYLICGVFHGRI